MRYRTRTVVTAVAVSALALGIAFASSRTDVVVDLTSGRSLSLTDRTLDVARAVEAKTTITAFLRTDDPERASAAALLLRYQRVSPHLRYRILDPRGASGEVRRLGVDLDFGSVAVARDGQVEVVPSVTEQDITGALLRLARGRSAEVCFTTGHGESAVTDETGEGLSRAAGLLLEHGYELSTIDLLAEGSIPSTCDAVAMVRPLAPLGAGAGADALRRWLDADGRLLVLSDPSSPPDVGIDGLLQGLGLGIRRGIVLEGDPELVLPDDPAAPIVRSYASANPIVRRLAPTFFPGLQGITTAPSDPEAGLTVAALAATSPASYLESDPLSGSFDPEVDEPGPVTIAGAAERTRLDGSVARRSRAVALGDSDFATNAHLGEAANGTLLVRSLDWLTLDAELEVLSANVPSFRPLAMTRARLTYGRFVALALLPGVFLLLGAVVWAVRRSR